LISKAGWVVQQKQFATESFSWRFSRGELINWRS
jgi:hypothetical protein